MFQKTANDADNTDIVAYTGNARLQTANATNYEINGDTFTGGPVECTNCPGIDKGIHFHDYSPLSFLPI